MEKILTKNNRIKNKKGDIPVTILVLGVFLICVTALASFHFFKNKMERVFVGVDLIEKMNSRIEEYNFYKNLGLSEEEIINSLDIKTDSQGNRYLYYEFIEKNNKLISVKYYLQD